MAENLIKKFEKLDIAKSPRFTAIMDKYNSFGKHMSVPAFWKSYVKVEDPSITLRQWRYFSDKFKTVQLSYIQNALAKSNEEALSTAKMEASSLDKLIQIGDVSLQAVVDNPELMESIPLKDRMRWLFSAMKARDTRFKTNLAAKQEEREASMFEKMMEGAQYGGYDADQVPVIEAEVINQNQSAEEQQVFDELSSGI